MPKWQWENKITLGNMIQMALILAGFIYGYATLSGSVSNSAEAVKAIPAIEGRVSTIETRINIGQAAREKFQDQMAGAVESLRQQNVQILQTQAAILARLEERNRP